MMWDREVNRSISLHTAADRRLFYWIVFVSPIFKAVSQYVLMRLLYERYLDSYYETNCICTLSTSPCLLSSVLIIHIALPGTTMSFYVLLLLH